MNQKGEWRYKALSVFPLNPCSLSKRAFKCSVSKWTLLAKVSQVKIAHYENFGRHFIGLYLKIVWSHTRERESTNWQLIKLPLTVRIFSINCSAMMPELGTLNGLRVRVMLPDALITAICSPPPCNPRVHLLTREYLLQRESKSF